MPIYMDRHDISETVTAENVAQIHQEDLKIQDHFGCRGLTYWFDDKRKTAFCLIEAPNEQAIVDMHEQAHGQVPHQIIEVDASIVESFLGRIEDPVKAQDTGLNIINDPAFRTIMVIDLRLLSLIQHETARFKSSLDNFNQAVPEMEILHESGGKLVKQNSNHYLISFKSVTQAVHAAFAVQKLFKEFRKGIDSDKLLLKIGLSAGVPVTEKNLFFGGAIKLAERICETVRGEIIISSEVKDLYDSENSTPLTETENIILLTQADEHFLELFMDYAETAWNDVNLKVDDFNKPVGYSKSQFYRKIILLTGKSPNVFIKDYRLNEALILLNRNTGNVSSIAYETGFSSPSYFTKCFQKRYGKSPSEYLPVRLGAGIPA